MFLILAISGIFFAAFFIVYKVNKTRLEAGALFSGFLLFLGGGYCWFAISSENPVLELTVIFIAMAVLLVLLFGIYVLIIFLLLNARAMLKRERLSFSNSLTLIFGVSLLLVTLISFIMQNRQIPFWVEGLWAAVISTLVYYFFHIFVFLVSTFLCNMARPPKKQDYIIVLGSGLIHGEVPPLLAGRIDKAIQFYTKQRQITTPPKLILSGGQGTDEVRPEGVAMEEYAHGKGIPLKDLLVEKESTSTFENMLFSKELIDKIQDGKPYHCIYSTSNYHLLRAGIYARKAGLPIDGIGAKTAFYYLPTALLREYVAFIWLHKKRTIAFGSIVFLGTLLFYIANYLAAAYL